MSHSLNLLMDVVENTIRLWSSATLIVQSS